MEEETEEDKQWERYYTIYGILSLVSGVFQLFLFYWSFFIGAEMLERAVQAPAGSWPWIIAICIPGIICHAIMRRIAYNLTYGKLDNPKTTRESAASSLVENLPAFWWIIPFLQLHCGILIIARMIIIRAVRYWYKKPNFKKVNHWIVIPDDAFDDIF